MALNNNHSSFHCYAQSGDDEVFAQTLEQLPVVETKLTLSCDVVLEASNSLIKLVTRNHNFCTCIRLNATTKYLTCPYYLKTYDETLLRKTH